MKLQVIIILGLIVLTGCTRPTEDVSKVTLTLPASVRSQSKISESLSASSASELKHVLINVSASDIPTLAVTWSAEEGSSICKGSICTLEVLNGKSRMIQVLAIYDDGTGTMQFNYGDSKVDVTNSMPAVNITVSSIQTSGVTPIETQIRGRYLTSPADGPTGSIEVRLYPDGKPSMLLGTAEMHKGWFSVFGIRGVKFDYLMNGLSLFGGPKSVDTISDTSLVSQVLVKWPTRWEDHDGTPQQRSDEDALFGFFGPGVGSEKVCYYSSASMSISYKYEDSGYTTPLTFNASGSGTQTRVDVTGRSGGNSCGSANNANPLYSGELYINPISQGDGRMIPPFGGIGGNLITVNGTSVTFSTLPGIATADIGSFVPFFVDESLFKGKYRIPGPGDSYRCGALFADSSVANSGVQLAGSPVTFTGSSAISMTLSSSIPSGKALLVCPRRPDLTFYQSALESRNFGGGGGGKYLTIEGTDGSFYKSGGRVLTVGACHPVKLKLFNNSATYSATAAVTATLPSSGTIQFYASSTCGTPITSQTISSGSSETGIIYLKATAAVTGATLSTMSVSGDGVSFNPSNVPFDAALPIFKVDAPSKWINGQCYPVTVEARYANEMTAYTQTSLPLGMTFNGVGANFATTEANCISSTAGGNTISGGTSVTFWTKTSTNGNYAMAITGTGFTNYSQPIDVAPETETPTFIRALFENTVTPGVCVPVRLSLVNANGYEVIARTPFPISFMPLLGLGQLATDGNCSTANFPVTISAGSSSTHIFVRPYVASQSIVLAPIGGLPLYTMDPAPTFASNPSQIQISTFPTFASKIVGEHEFGSSQNLSLTVTPGGSTVTCESSADGGTTWSACSASSATGSTFTWAKADAIAKKKFRLSINPSGGQSASTEFDPSLSFGPEFQVVTCGTTLSANTTSSALSTALTNFNNVCLGTGVQVTCDTPANIGWGQSVIGHSSRNMVVASGSSAVTCFTSTPAGATNGGFVLANLSFDLNGSSCSTGAMKGLSVNSGASAGQYNVLVANSNFSITGSSACLMRGISLTGNSATTKVAVINNAFTMNSAASTNLPTGIYLDNTHLGDLDVARNTFVVTTPTYDSYGIVVERVSGGTTNGALNILGNDFSGNKLAALVDIATSQTNPPTVRFENNSVTSASTPSRPVITVSRGNNHSFTNNKLTFNFSSTAYGFLSLKTDGQTTMSAKLIANKIVHQGSDHFLVPYADTATTLTVNLTQNSFLSTSSTSGGNSRVIWGSGSGTINLTTASALETTTGANRICETDSTYGWSGGPTNAVTGLSGLTTAYSATVNNETCP